MPASERDTLKAAIAAAQQVIKRPPPRLSADDEIEIVADRIRRTGVA